MGRNERNTERLDNMKCFKLQETSDNYFYFAFIDSRLEESNEYHFTSSYHVLAARLMGLRYTDYLRYCQSRGARLRGKLGYAHPIWKDRKEAEIVMSELNKNWEILEKSINFID